jgi:hypothetical protein
MRRPGFSAGPFSIYFYFIEVSEPKMPVSADLFFASNGLILGGFLVLSRKFSRLWGLTRDFAGIFEGGISSFGNSRRKSNGNRSVASAASLLKPSAERCRFAAAYLSAQLKPRPKHYGSCFARWPTHAMKLHEWNTRHPAPGASAYYCNQTA